MAQLVRKIHKVPLLLRQDEHNSDAYDPKVVSFGPYHHGKEELQLCERVKPLSVQKFVDGSGKDMLFFKQKIIDVIADARSCYVEGSTDRYNDDQFANMMLLDACFLIHSLQIDKNSTVYDRFIYEYAGTLVLFLINRDIYLLENQIPFTILTLLINLRYGTEGEQALNNFLHQSIWGQIQPNATHWVAEEFKQQLPLHLLEAFHRVLVWEPIRESRSVETDKNVDVKKYFKNFRSAKDLKARGIHFKPSPNKSLKGIKFVPGVSYAELQLPTWFVSTLSKVFFPNMIAYELCPGSRFETTVVSYLNFMKLLIESPADVKELREKNILLITLGSDEEVVKFYSELNTYEVASVYTFQEVKRGIQDHYDSLGRTWMSQMIHTYLSTPWSILGWLVGLVLLVLTFLQTYYTMIGFEPKPRRRLG